MLNSGQKWERSLVSWPFRCDRCKKEVAGNEYGVRVEEYRHGDLHRAVTVCLDCIGQWIRGRFNMIQLRGG